jgi:hypothetical protein
MLRTIVILSCAGGIAHANPAPMSITADGVRMTYLYHNAATGETIASRPAGARGTVSTPAWKTDGGDVCGHQPGIGMLLIADDPADPERFGLIHMDWGDIEPDTVVSMVQFSASTEYPDVDLDGDGLADGVPGLGIRLTFFRGENGFGGGGTAEEAGVVTLVDIPGNLGGAGIEGYLYSVDLAGVGSAEGVPLGSTDVDGDGLADFGYSIEYLHPPTDDQEPRRRTYLQLGTPSGQAVPDGMGGWTIVPDPAPTAQGTTDAIDVYRRDVFGEPEYVETIGGQFSCDPSASGFYAQIALSLFVQAEPDCPADLFPSNAPDGQLNFFDLSAYLGLFNAQDPVADFFPDGGDGQFNFFDVAAYLAAYNAGCP